MPCFPRHGVFVIRVCQISTMAPGEGGNNTVIGVLDISHPAEFNANNMHTVCSNIQGRN